MPGLDGEAAADAGSATCDEDRIAWKFHGSFCCLRTVRSGRETVAEHRQAADGLRFGHLVLKNVPVLGELTVFEACDIGGDPRRGTTVA